MNIIYCMDCETVRGRAIELCPICSTDNKPRYKTIFQSTAGTWFVYDRWKSKTLNADDITLRLNRMTALLEAK